jgi:hypothetical protein
MNGEGGWIEHGLARLRPHRVPLTLAVDALVVVACWNFTYLFASASSAGGRPARATTSSSSSA